MKKSLALIALSGTLVFGVQAQELPQPSPAAEIEQRVGLTDIEIEWSSPAVNDRAIWGELVPYNQLWRAGANMATSIEFSTDVRIAGETVEAGDYSIFIMPMEKGEWTWILNTNTELWGVGGYSEDQDVLRVNVEAMSNDSKGPERLRYAVENFDNNGGEIVMEWAGMRVAVPFEVDVHDIAMKNIQIAIDEAEEDKLWQVYRNAASYTVNSGKELEAGLKWIQMSLELNKDSWYSHWVHAEVLAALGKIEEAKTVGNEAIKMGEYNAKEAGREFTYGEGLRAEMAGWK
jgi:tetratricopeptide (TPR) repeat protein